MWQRRQRNEANNLIEIKHLSWHKKNQLLLLQKLPATPWVGECWENYLSVSWYAFLVPALLSQVQVASQGACSLSRRALWEQEHTHAYQWSPCHEDLYPPRSKTTHPVCSRPPALGVPSLSLVKMEYSAQSWREATWLFYGFSLGKIEDTLCFLPQVQIVICLGNGATENNNSKEFEELQVCCHSTCVNLSCWDANPSGLHPHRLRRAGSKMWGLD